MKRDSDLFREILLQVEALPPDDIEKSPWHIIDIAGRNIVEIRYHAQMLVEQGFLNVDAYNAWTSGSPYMRGNFIKCRPDALTASGHDFLDSVRDPSVWRDTKTIAARAGGFTISLLSEIAKAVIKAKISDHTGLRV